MSDHQDPLQSDASADPRGSKRSRTPVITDADSRRIYRKLLTGRALTLLSFFGLLLLFALQNIVSDTGSLRFWLVQSVPLLIFVPGLLKPLQRAAHRTFSWLCFVCLIYFVAIVPPLMGRGALTDWVMLTLICTLFIAAMMTSRWLQYWNYYLSTQSQQRDATA